MQVLSLEDQAAADRLTAFLLGEVYRSVAKVLAQSNPSVAEALFGRVETIVATTLRRINAEQAEGPNSTAIALSVCRDVGDVLKAAHALPRQVATSAGGDMDAKPARRTVPRLATKAA